MIHVTVTIIAVISPLCIIQSVLLYSRQAERKAKDVGFKRKARKVKLEVKTLRLKAKFIELKRSAKVAMAFAVQQDHKARQAKRRWHDAERRP